MPVCLLDTDILSEVLKQKDAVVVARAAAYLQTHQQFTISVITRNEIIRGLKATAAHKQLQKFAAFCLHSVVLPLTESIFDRAADLWVTTHAAGQPKKDADLLIAATAMEHGLALVTGNAGDFSWITGLLLESRSTPGR